MSQYVFACNFVGLLFGKEYANSAIVLQLLLWATIFIFLNTLSSYLLIASGRQHYNVVSYGIGAVSTVFFSLILVPLYSYIGAGISLLVGQMLLFIVAIHLISKTLLKLSIMRIIIKPFFSSLTMWGLIYFLRGWNVWFSLFIGILFYIILLFSFKVVTQEDVVLVNNILCRRFKL